MTPRRFSKLLFTLLALIGLTFMSAPAFSQDEGDLDKEIEAIEAKAKEAYDRGDYLEAIRLLNKCNSLRPHPNYLINIAFTYSAMSDCTNAKTFVQSATDDPRLDADARVAAQDIVKNCVEKPVKIVEPPPPEDSILPWVGYPLLVVGLIGMTSLIVQDQLLLADKEEFNRAKEAGELTEEQIDQQVQELNQREISTGLEISFFVGTSLMTIAGFTVLLLDLIQDPKPVHSTKNTLRFSPFLGLGRAGFFLEITLD